MRRKNMAKNYPKRCQIAKISTPFWEIDVAENNRDRFRTGSANNADSAHAQRKMAKNSRNRFLVAEISIP